MLSSSLVAPVTFDPNYNFGVEIECAYAFNANPDSISRDRLMQHHVEKLPDKFKGSTIGDHIVSSWDLLTDGSIRGNGCGYGWEFITPIYRGEVGREAMLAAFKALRPHLQANRSCGLHIHASHPNFNQTHIPSLVRVMRHLEPIFFAMTDRSRAHNSYCQPISNNHIALLNLKKAESIGERARYVDRYHGLNTWSYYEGTGIEFRYFHVPRTATRLDAWLRLCYMAMNYAMKNTVPRTITPALTVLPRPLHDKRVLRLTSRLAA